MKIAQVCPRYYPYIGGVETHVMEISKRLAEKGYEIDVITTDPVGELPKREIVNGVVVRRFKSWAPSEAYYFSGDLKSYLVKTSESYDIVHAHCYHALPALYTVQAKCKKLVFTSHYHGKGHTFLRNVLHIPYRYVAKRIFEKADRIIFVSNYEKSLVMSKFNIEEQKVILIPNGINPEEYGAQKRGYGDGKIILYVGRLEKYKGLDYVIRALPKLDERTRLEVIGKGPYKKALLKLINELGVTDRVMFFQDLQRGELLQKYANADLFVYLSQLEAYGISVAEALASGTPCIVVKNSALKEWVDGENCFGIDHPINIDNLVNMINDIMGKTRFNAIRLPTWDESVEKLIHVYEQVISS